MFMPMCEYDRTAYTRQTNRQKGRARPEASEIKRDKDREGRGRARGGTVDKNTITSGLVPVDDSSGGSVRAIVEERRQMSLICPAFKFSGFVSVCFVRV
jgi:hypothetical protein